MAKKKRSEKTKAILILLGLLGAACLLVFHSFLFGDETLVFDGAGSDTRQQYLMWYNAVVNHLRSGNLSWWDFTNGFGGSMFNYYIFQPLVLVVYGVGTLFGPQQIPGLMVYLMIGEILLSGLFCYLLLSQWNYAEGAKVIASFLYALNGYFVVWGQHYSLGFICLELPLLLLMVEKGITSGIWCLGISLMSALIVLSGYYQGYMAILGIAIYITFRVLLFEDAPFSKRLRKYFAQGLSVGLGVGLGAVNLLPSAGSLAITSRLEQNGTLLQRFLGELGPYGKEYYRTLLYRVFGINLQGTGRFFLGEGNYYEAANVSLGVLLVLMLFQFIFQLRQEKLRVRQYIALAAGGAVCAFALLIRAGSLIFNGFAYSFSRHTFLFLPLGAMLICFTLDRILRRGRAQKAALLLSAVLSAAVYLKAYRNYMVSDYQLNALLLLLGMLAMAAGLWRFSVGKLRREALLRLLAAAVFVCGVSDVYLSYNRRESLRKSDETFFGAYDGDTMEALEQLRSLDDQFFRVEKDYAEAAYYLDSAAQGYAAVTTYNSQQNSNIQQFVRTLAPRLLTGYDVNHYDFRNLLTDPVLGALMGVKYLLSHDEDLHLDHYRLIAQAGEVFVYRNELCDSIASFYTKTISEAEYDRVKQDILRWDLLPDYLITSEETDLETDASAYENRKKVCADEEMDLSSLGGLLRSEEDGYATEVTGQLEIPLALKTGQEAGSICLSMEIKTDSSAQLVFSFDSGAETDYFSFGKNTYQLPVPPQAKSVLIRAEDPEESFTISKLHLYCSSYPAEEKAEAQILVTRPARDDRVEGTIRTDQAGIVMLAMPYQEGWEARVDGQIVDQLKVDYGFVGLRLEAGEHTFSLSYHPPLLKEGALLSAASALLWLGIFCFLRLRGNKRKRAGMTET